MNASKQKHIGTKTNTITSKCKLIENEPLLQVMTFDYPITTVLQI